MFGKVKISSSKSLGYTITIFIYENKLSMLLIHRVQLINLQCTEFSKQL